MIAMLVANSFCHIEVLCLSVSWYSILWENLLEAQIFKDIMVLIF